jgi:hypothetical protein
MIWLSWRQFRTQALVAGVAFVAGAVWLLVLGVRLRDGYQTLTGCADGCSEAAARDAMQGTYGHTVVLTGLAVLAVPALLGAFWGAPLVAREFETGTHRLVWNQSVTRTRWLAVRIGTILLAAIVVTAAVSALFTWSVSPYEALLEDRFAAVAFGTRNVAPVAYAVFAVVSGAALGLLLRRTLPAMAVTLALFAGLQLLMPLVVRPHLQIPVTTTEAFRRADAGYISLEPDGHFSVAGYFKAGSWVLSTATLLDPNGEPVAQGSRDDVAEDPLGDCQGDVMDCMEQSGYQVTSTYQPAERYWAFQWLESSIFVALAAAIGGLAFWRIRKGW